MTTFNDQLCDFWKMFENGKKMVLSTSLDDYVTSRMMSIIQMDGFLYFQTDKTFRVFATKDHTKGGLFKVSGKVVKGRKKNPEKFGNTPDHCFIINDDVSALPIPDELDRQYYIDLAWKRLKDYGVEREGGGSEQCN